MRAIKAIWIRNMKNFVRDRMRLFFTIFMSFFFLFIFSFVMESTIKGIVENPITYLISGIIIMTVFQAALNNSMNTIDDVASGFMREIIVAPIQRWQISVGQILSSATIALLQGIIVVIVALFMGLTLTLLQFVEMILVMLLVGVTFASIGLFLATLAKSSTTFQLLISIVVLPLTFLSGAYIPTTVLPAFLNPVVFLNPLTYTTSIFRYISLGLSDVSTDELVRMGVAFDVSGWVITPLMGMWIILAIGLIFFSLATIQFNKADFSIVKSRGRRPH
ncbi:ABC transporter permease [Rubeoparvulum massiliense]|uniref:ABC transporter permease n=1 Tax=Rubeoparvulum massiliense TaxID=1631346 RepID=UPI00065E6591|nr:ABC transporter permease [Rubeoparvulum massiliense]